MAAKKKPMFIEPMASKLVSELPDRFWRRNYLR